MGYVKEVETISTPVDVDNKSTETNLPDKQDRYLSISGALGLDIEKMSTTQHKWLKEIYEWAKDKDNSETEIISKIITKKNEIGTPGLGEDRISQFYTWLRCSKDYEEAKNRLMKAEGYGN